MRLYEFCFQLTDLKESITLKEFQPVVACSFTAALCLIMAVFYRQDCYFITYAVWIKCFNIHFMKVAWPPQFFRQSKSY